MMEQISNGIFVVHTKRKLLGLVKSVYSERADYNEELGDWVEGFRRRPEERISFDHWGRIVELIDYHIEGSIREKRTFAFDGNGDLIEKKAFDAIDRLLYRTIYTCDSKGRRTMVTTYEADGDLSDKITHTYDSEGKLSQMIAYYPDGSLKRRGVLLTGEDGVLTWRWVRYNPDGSIIDSRIRIDDLNSKLIQEVFYDADGSLKSKRLSYHDSDGNEIKRDYYDARGSQDRRYLFEYDCLGNIIKQTQYSAQDSIEEQRIYGYEFDKIGNWIKKAMQIMILDSDPPKYKPSLVIYRTLTYWPEPQS